MSRLPSRILAPNGQPVAQWLYPSPRQNPKAYRPRYKLGTHYKDNVSSYDRSELVDYSRQLYAQIGDLATAIRQKNSWAFGDAWEPHYMGLNTKWGEEAEEWLKNSFYPTLNVRGPLFHFRRTMELSGMAWDYDGDDVMVLTESESHFPQIALFPSTRIGSGENYERRDEVKGGPYDGARIHDGVIYNRNGRAVAVRILSEDPSKPPQDISLNNADLAFEPEWSDQNRGVPRPATCLLRWMDLQDIDHFIQKGMKRAASFGLKMKTAEGESVQGNEIITGEETVTDLDGASDTRDIHEERIGDGGDLYYLSAPDGEDVEELDFKNPHPNVEAFIQRVKRECLTSVGWFYELLNLESTGRAPSRLVCDLANQSIWSRQETGERRARRIINYGIAQAMKGGFISKNNDGSDPYKWEFGMPARLSVDAGNDEQASREAVKMGMSTKAIEAQKKGLRGEAIRKARKAEVRAEFLDAKELKEEFGLPFEYVMERIDQRSPNPVFNQPKPQQQSQTPPK
jgi:hypothetical protein